MKVIHVFKGGNKKFSEPFIEFINGNFDIKEHEFLITSIKENKNKNKNITNISVWGFFLNSYKLFFSDKIILHSLNFPWVIIFLFLNPWLLKKTIGVLWGSDLYYYKNRKKTIMHNIYEFVRKIIFKNINGIATLVKGDYDLAQKWYNTNSKYFHAYYYSKPMDDAVKSCLNKKLTNIEVINKNSISIILGNSASKSNNHFAAIDILSKFKDENIKIYCPLSYGDMDYASKVKDYGQKVFGDKFIPIDKFMKVDEYISFLSTMDIGLFNNDRQQALGNINSLLNLGKKVYMLKNTTMWSELSISFELNLYDINEIPERSFEEFVFEDSILLNDNIRKLNSFSNIDNVKSIWSAIFK